MQRVLPGRWASRWSGVDHILAHLYAPHLERDISYPYLGLLVSGGHTIIARVERYDRIEVLGTTIDDACGEAFDKVAKFYDIGFPGRRGNRPAFPDGKPARLPLPEALPAQGRGLLRRFLFRV